MLVAGVLVAVAYLAFLAYDTLLRQASRAGIPTSSGGACNVTEGGTRKQVAAKCGRACDHGDIPKGPCHSRPMWPAQVLDLCGPSCDVYSSVAVCYGQEGVVLFEDGRFPTCHW